MRRCASKSLVNGGFALRGDSTVDMLATSSDPTWEKKSVRPHVPLSDPPCGHGTTHKLGSWGAV